MQDKNITGFSRLTKAEKIQWVTEHFTAVPEQAAAELAGFWHTDEKLQKVLDGFSENTLSNYTLPYGIAPNFLINGRQYAVPMVIEESSVVAAASSAAKFWHSRGGFHAKVISTRKLGQVHFAWFGDFTKLRAVFEELRDTMLSEAAPLTLNMGQRGGGILDVELLDFSLVEPTYYQLRVTFETCDSMGANFINSVLESFADTLQRFIETHPAFDDHERDVEIIMSILSNYTPECLVRAWVEWPIDQLGEDYNGIAAAAFAEKFAKAVRIAHVDPYRAVTHNKGIFNGIDAVVLATANDFRAVEACGHAFAARDGMYRGLSHCTIENGMFKFWLEIPLALGTIGGLTRLHPLARRTLEILGNPSAPELMEIVAVTGLAQNFAAVRSLITTGIQHGHMKMHLTNILNHLGVSEEEMVAAEAYFADKVVSFTGVRDYIETFRKQTPSVAPQE